MRALMAPDVSHPRIPKVHPVAGRSREGERPRDRPFTPTAPLVAQVLAELDDLGAGVPERDDETLQ